MLQWLSNYINGQAGFDHLPSVFVKLSRAVKRQDEARGHAEEGDRLAYAAVGSFLPALFYYNLNSIIHPKVTPFVPHGTELCCSVVLTQLPALLSALQVDLVDDTYYFLSVIELVVVLLVSLTVRILLFSQPDERKS